MEYKKDLDNISNQGCLWTILKRRKSLNVIHTYSDSGTGVTAAVGRVAIVESENRIKVFHQLYYLNKYIN